MQSDTLMTGLCSYLLGETVGATGSIENITSVAVNGQTLPGYIDIGLMDTMLDLLLETVGAVVTCLLMLPGKCRCPIIWKTKEKRKEDEHA